MKILLISQYFPPDITAAAFRISETAELLYQKGYEITVLTAIPHKTNNIESYENIDNLFKFQVIRCPIKKLSREGTLGYITHYLSFMTFSILWGLFKTGLRYDYIIASSPPLFVGIAGFILSKFKRAKFLLDVRDLWPDTAVAAKQLNPEGVIYRLGKKVEKFLYCKSNLITCVSNRMKKAISLWKNPKEILVIYNAISGKYIEKIDKYIQLKDPSIKYYSLKLKYIGNIGLLQNLRIVCEAATSFHTEEVEFIIVGDGVEKEKLKKNTEKKGGSNVKFPGKCSKEESLDVMLDSSALIVHLKEEKVLTKTIPSKVFDYMLSGKPILYGIKGEGKDILDGLPGNIYFAPDNKKSLVNAIKELKKRYTYYEKEAIKNREYLLENFTREKMVNKLINFLEDKK